MPTLLLQTNDSNSGVEGGDLVVVAIIIAVTVVLVSLLRVALRTAFRALASRGLAGKPTRWRTRSPRVFGESYELAELRRRQRTDATATMIARTLSVVAWTVAAIVILRHLDIDAVFAISGAGFLGVALAVGGQHSVADFLSGLHMLLEDRCGEGDTIRLRIQDEVVTGKVVAVGAFACRVETDEATLHIANRELATVVNLSQRGHTSLIEFVTDRIPPLFELEADLRESYASTDGYDPSLDGLVLHRIDQRGANPLATIRTARPLTDVQLARLGEAAGSA